jgi:hypothetical protein
MRFVSDVESKQNFRGHSDPMPDWRQLYGATIIETNSEHLDLLIEETLRAIGARLDELLELKGYDDEWREIHEASKSLLILRANSRLWNREQPS